MQKVIICAGPGSSRIECAEELRYSMPQVDVLLCSTAADIEQQLCKKVLPTFPMVMLQFYLGQHPGGSRGAQDWHSGFMDALDVELASRNLLRKPNIKTKVNQDTGSVFFICSWRFGVQPADVVKCALAFEASFARKGWLHQSGLRRVFQWLSAIIILIILLLLISSLIIKIIKFFV
jgi:hypothetical protein